MTSQTLATTPTVPGRLRSVLGRLSSDAGPFVGLFVLCVALFIATPDFLTGPNLVNVGIQASTIAVMAFGMTFVIVAGGIDLSVGSVAALSAMTSAWFYTSVGIPGWLALIAGLATGALLGAVSGTAVAWFRLPAFIATLAMLSVARGLTLVISDGRPIAVAPEVAWLGGDIEIPGTGGAMIPGIGIPAVVPVPILVLVVAGLVAAFVLNRTVIGRSMYAVGGNEEAARLSGIPVKRVLITVFALSGLFAALAGMLLAGRLETAQPQAAVGYELDAIAAVVIGGASLSGGVGKVSGTLVGALILAVIRNGLNLLNVSSFWQQVVIGLVIAIAVGVDVLRRRSSRH